MPSSHKIWITYLSSLILSIIIVGTSLGQSLQLLGHFDYVTSRGTDVWEYVDTLTNKVYAVAGEYGSFVIIDVTDPTQPVLTSRVAVNGFDVKVWNAKVYTVASGGLDGKIYNIRDPSNPTPMGSFVGGHNIFIDNYGRLFNTIQEVYDLKARAGLPTYLGKLGDSRTTHDLTVRGNRVISCDGKAGTSVYEYSDVGAPMLIMQFKDGDFGYHHQGDFSKDGKFLFVTDELSSGTSTDIFVWDIHDTDNPELVNEIIDPDAVPHNLYVRGDYMFVSHYTAGLKVFDISDGRAPVLADEFDTHEATGDVYEGAFGVYPSPTTGNIYVTDSDNGLFVFEWDLSLTNHEEQTLPNVELFQSSDQSTLFIRQQQPQGGLLLLYSINGQLISSTAVPLNKEYRFSLLGLPSGIFTAVLRVSKKPLSKIIVKSN